MDRLFFHFSDLPDSRTSAFSKFRIRANEVTQQAAANDRVPSLSPLRNSLFSMVSLLGWLFFSIGLCASPGNVAAESTLPRLQDPTVGWNGQYAVGRWTPIRLPVSVEETTQTQLEVRAIDPDGHRVTYSSETKELPPGDHMLEGLFKVGRLDGDVDVRINQGEWLKGTPGRTDWLVPPLLPSEKLIVTVGNPHGFDFADDAAVARVKVVDLDPASLPTMPLAYDSVTSLLLAGTAELTDRQSEAIRAWVAAGGRITVSLPQDVAAARRQLLKWFPIEVEEVPVTAREFGSLEAFAGKNIRVPQTSPLPIPQLRFDEGAVISSSRSIPFVVRVPYAMGSITVLAMDLTARPLSEWKGLSAFCQRLVGAESRPDLADRGIVKGSQLSSTGITDVATQLHAVQEHFEKVERFSPWFVLGCLLGLLIVIGPIDYLLVHRVLKRPFLTWITFPAMAASAAVIATFLATSSNGNDFHANQLSLVNIDVATHQVQGRYFVNLYSPSTLQSTVSVVPAQIASGGGTRLQARLSWTGTPESTFGGMLRSSGLERGAVYQQRSDESLTELPMMQWSSKALVAEGSQLTEDLVECQLKASPTGSLSGTILHRLPSEIEDWMVVYGNRVYRQLKTRDDVHSLPFPPRQIWRVEQPGVFQRELRPYLTGIMTMATARFGARNTKEVTQQQSSYDQLSLDPFELIRILTFFDEVGGDRYTGLTNQLLNREDCSHLLKLGRAILFGRMTLRSATFEIDDQVLEPDRETTFIRLILPVEKSSELLKDLKRVVPD